MKNLYTFPILFLWIFVIIQISCSSTPEEKPVDTRPSFYELIDQGGDLTFNIITDYSKILENKSTEGNQYQNATLSVTKNGQSIINTEVQIRPRGVTRKKICDYPPLMIKIQKEARDSLQLRKSDNLKIALPCKEDNEFKEWIIKEQLVYQMYAQIADAHYKTNKITLNIVDSLSNVHIDNKVAFIIEPTDVMAHRNGCTFDENDQSPVKKINKDQYKNYVMFQYMIGNTDWNLSGRHNIRMLGCDELLGPTPVPYDFDYSGLVNTEYATPHPMLPIKKVTDRMFQFKGKPDEDFSESIQLFQSKKSNLYNIIDASMDLSSSTRKEMTAYLDQFFDEIKDPENIKDAILKARKR